MKYSDFRNQFTDQPIFSLTDIRQAYPKFHRRRLHEWQAKGYIQNLLRGYYYLKERKFDEEALFYIANRIYSPSYLSLESALSHYQLIPEIVYNMTSVSTKKTNSFHTPLGGFQYFSIKPVLFSGYKIIRNTAVPYKIATPEKAIFDFLYLKTHYKTRDDFYELRINTSLFKNIISKIKLELWVAQSKNRALKERANELWEAINHA